MNKINFALLIICACIVGCSPKNEPTMDGGNNSSTGTGVCDGSFTIGKNKKVVFSPGNLQYQRSSNTWRFAEQQYDVIELDHWESDSTKWIDLFEWSNSCNNFGTEYGMHVEGDYSWEAQENAEKRFYEDTAFIDWGQKMGKEWFTLSQPEWEYLMEQRPNAAKLWGMACVNGINCIVVLPDNITLPSSISFKCGETHPKTYTDKDIQDAIKEKNSYTSAEWNQLENLGAVLFILNDDFDGCYWTRSINTHHASNGLLTNAHTFSATSWMGLFISIGCSNDRSSSNFVRLVKLQK